jgi:pimeloyl-ACP methyl ester carboxylesterase
MPALALRALRTVLATALLLSIGNVVLAQSNSAPAIAEDQRILPYVKPGQRVDIGGRHINLHCTGAGSPTVILMSGLSSWSVVWYKTQPGIAQKTRVCARDRAGYGFSDPAPRPQILSDAVDDLNLALKAASIPKPVVLVGHSLGGIEARLYAERWPQEVVGMVLVDTSPAAEGLVNEAQPGFDEAIKRENYASRKLYCALLAAHGPLESSRPEYETCSLPLPSDTPAAFRKIFPQFFTAYYAATQVSLMSSLFVHRYDSVDRRSLGAMPLVVLSVKNSWGNDSPAILQYSKVWIEMHEALARLSSRGVHRLVKESSHEIQLDQPQAVIDAVEEVLRQLPAQSRMKDQ